MIVDAPGQRARDGQATGLSARRRSRTPATGGLDVERPPRSLAIVSGKGGVGKSLLAVNLSLAMARFAERRRVLLVDGDAGLANADLLLGWIPSFTLSDWIEGRVGFDRLLTRGTDRLDLLVSGSSEPGANLIARLAAGRPDDPFAARFAEHDLTVFDLGAGIGASVVEVACACDRVWLVATPEPTSLADAYTMARRLVERRPEVDLELVVNRARDAEEGARTHLALERMTRRFLDRPLPLRAVLPDDPAARTAVARQVPLFDDAPRAPISRRIRLLADSIGEELAGATA
ncbi:MAG: P-loop NTPase [bacterium]|nr:P-loop NTPase [bacterium]